MLELLAQASIEATTVEVLKLFSQLATAGGLGGLAWYLIVKHIPRQNESFIKSIEAIQTTFATECREQREMYSMQIDNQREQCRQEIASLTESHKSSVDRIISLVKGDGGD